MQINSIFESFATTLERWTTGASSKGALGTLSEDTICLFIAGSYLQYGACLENIEMEVPHPSLLVPAGAQKDVDIRVVGDAGCDWLEVKLDKKIPSGRTLNKTNRFGGLIDDMLRLSIIEEGKRFMVYVTDEIMAEYFRRTCPALLNGPELRLDSTFLEGLPASASKELDPVVRARLSPGGALALIISTRVVHPWTCVLYEISPGVSN